MFAQRCESEEPVDHMLVDGDGSKGLRGGTSRGWPPVEVGHAACRSGAGRAKDQWLDMDCRTAPWMC
ncbi:hypothetical protein C8Q76DRAFT_701185 [Earliella scabrosa]|nr:hypothetical protein C8Q76DRAFT_701185 [Earliella scabrosa]